MATPTSTQDATAAAAPAGQNTAPTALVPAPAAPAVVVAPLGDDVDELLGRVEDYDDGLDMMVRGAEKMMLAAQAGTYSLDKTASLLAALGGDAEEMDFASVLGTLIERLTNPTSNPCLRQLDAETLANVRRIGFDVAGDIAHSLSRDYIAKLARLTDPHAEKDTHLGGGEQR